MNAQSNPTNQDSQETETEVPSEGAVPTEKRDMQLQHALSAWVPLLFLSGLNKQTVRLLLLGIVLSLWVAIDHRTKPSKPWQYKAWRWRPILEAIAAGIGLLLIGMSFPTSILAWGVRWLLGRVEHSSKATNRGGKIAIALMPPLRCSFYGVLLVCFAQIACTALASILQPAWIYRVEELFLRVRETTRGFSLTSLPYLGGALIVMIAISAAIPNLTVLRWFTTIRRKISLVYLFLVTITAFTFFSSTHVEFKRSGWVADLRPMFARQLDAIEYHQRELIANTIVYQRVRMISAQDRMALAAMLATLREKPSHEQVTSAERMGRSIGEGGPGYGHMSLGTRQHRPPDAESESEAVDRIRRWLADPESNAPSMGDLDASGAVDNRLTRGSHAARSAAVESLRSAIGEVASNLAPPVLSAFIDGIVRSMPERSIPIERLRSITEFALVRDWIEDYDRIQIERGLTAAVRLNLRVLNNSSETEPAVPVMSGVAREPSTRPTMGREPGALERAAWRDTFVGLRIRRGSGGQMDFELVPRSVSSRGRITEERAEPPPIPRPRSTPRGH